ncbi:MAG: hypothetical protein HWD60_19135 [Defluviicoccus sp.]|nr:MAG: hypothetical protein HWD60_19135 [Defluviicoccus sp.]
MSRPSNKHPAPFSLRLTPEERGRLEKQAGGMPLGAYIRGRLLGEGGESRRTRGRFPVKDHTALARLLAALGQSRLAGNVNQLAKAANSGSLPLDEETRRDLRSACADIAAMKRLLMDALGIREH